VKESVAALARLPGVWRGGELENAAHPVVATGHRALDRELPCGGWPVGTLSEVMHDGVGIGEVGFLAGTLARAAQDKRLIAWINPPHLPYAPALEQAKLALDQCLVVRPGCREDAWWAAEQALKSGACAAVLLWMNERLTRETEQYAWLRRLQMAAEAGRCIAIIFRSTAAESLSSPAHLRIALACDKEGLAIRIAKRRGPTLGSPIRIDSKSRERLLPKPGLAKRELVEIIATRLRVVA
jgi:hypothetical protein